MESVWRWDDLVAWIVFGVKCKSFIIYSFTFAFLFVERLMNKFVPAIKMGAWKFKALYFFDNQKPPNPAGVAVVSRQVMKILILSLEFTLQQLFNICLQKITSGWWGINKLRTTDSYRFRFKGKVPFNSIVVRLEACNGEGIQPTFIFRP